MGKKIHVFESNGQWYYTGFNTGKVVGPFSTELLAWMAFRRSLVVNEE